MLRLSVIKGPDKGKTQVFHSKRVTIGDDGRNDFELSDAMVSRFHGVFEVNDKETFTFRDLGSLNGTYIRCGDENHKLHDRSGTKGVTLEGRARVALGQTLIEVELDPRSTHVDSAPLLPSAPLPPPVRDDIDKLDGSGGENAATSRREFDTSPQETRPPTGDHTPRRTERAQVGGEDLRESIVRRVQEAPEHLAERLSPKADRLQVVFRLARELNGLNKIEDILERVVEATFEMFPLANFFAIVVPSDEPDGPMQPLFARARDEQLGSDLILSQSLLREVVEKRESVLFVRDNLSAEDTRKSIVMAQITACLAAPLFGQRRLMGVMQVDSRGRSGMFGYDDLDLFTVLASSAAFAMERASLTRNIYEMFEAFVYASVAAIDSRDPTTAGHSQRVANFTLRMAKAVNRSDHSPLIDVSFSSDELTELRYAALLHDFGKIGVREEVLQKAARLMPGTYGTLIQRIETARALRQQAILADYQQQLLREKRPPTPGDLADLDRRGQEHHAQFNRYRNTVMELQHGSALTPRHRQVVEEMTNINFVDAHGTSHPLLTEAEARDLLIPYGTLNDEERQHIESHAALSRDYLSRIPWSEELSQIPCIAGQHHEKLDGSGYPRGITAEEISPQVRILTIADIFDALTATDRPYKKARSVDAALDILHEEAEEGKLDREILHVFANDVVPDIRHDVGQKNR